MRGCQLKIQINCQNIFNVILEGIVQHKFGGAWEKGSDYSTCTMQPAT